MTKSIFEIQFNKHYADYIEAHKTDGKDIIQLTNEALKYSCEQLGVHGKEDYKRKVRCSHSPN